MNNHPSSNTTNLLDCTAVAAALFANQEHVLHLNEHTTFAEIPKLDPAVTPKKYLSQIFRGLVGTAAAAQYAAFAAPPRTEEEDSHDDEIDDEKRDFRSLRKPRPVSSDKLSTKSTRLREARTQHQRTTKSTTTPRSLSSLSTNQPQHQQQKIGGNHKSSAANSRSSSTLSQQPHQLFESRLSRKANIIQTVIREFLTHRLYRRQSCSSSAENQYHNNNNSGSIRTIWLGCGFLSLRHSAPVTAGVLGRLLHLSAVKEAENTSIVVARTLELFDACIVGNELVANHSKTSTQNSHHNHSILPVPAYQISINKSFDNSRHHQNNVDDMSATFCQDSIRPSKQLCSVQLKIPQPPFAPPMMMMDLVRSFILACKDSSSSVVQHFLQNPAISKWISQIPVPTNNNTNADQQGNATFLSSTDAPHQQVYPENTSPYRPRHQQPTNNSTSSSSSLLWNAYLEAISTVAGEQNAEEVAEFVRALAAFVIANEIRLVHSSNHKNDSRKNNNLNNPQNTTKGFSKPTSRSGLLPATFRDAQGLQHLADLLQQPSAETLLTTLQAIPTGGRTPLHSTNHHSSMLSKLSMIERVDDNSTENNRTKRNLFGGEVDENGNDVTDFSKLPRHVDASIPHYSSSSIFANSSATSTSYHHGTSSTTNSFQPLLKIAFLPDAIYRNLLDWIVGTCNSRLSKLSCVGAGVREPTRIVCAMCETRNAESLFGTLPHSLLPMHLVGDFVTDKWRTIHSRLEKRHEVERHQMMLNAESQSRERSYDSQDESVGVVGTMEWTSPQLLPLFSVSSSSASSSTTTKSTSQLTMKWPLSGILLHGLVSSVATLRKNKMGGALSHSGAASSSGTISFQHIHGSVNYTSMTTSATPAFILADDDSSKRFAGVSTLYGSAADDTLAAQKWRAGEHKSAIEAIEKYCSVFDDIFSCSSSNNSNSSTTTMDHDFLFSSLGYSSLMLSSQSESLLSSTNHQLDALQDERTQNLLFLDSTFAQAVALRFRMDTVVRPPQVPKMHFAPLSSIPASLSGENSNKQKKMIEDSRNPSEKANNLLKNLHRDVHNNNNTSTKTKTPSTEPNSVSSSVEVGMNHYRTDLTKNRFSASASSTATGELNNNNNKSALASAYQSNKGCFPPIYNSRNASTKQQHQHAQDQEHETSMTSITREQSIPFSEPDPAPPTPHSVPLGHDEKQKILSQHNNNNNSNKQSTVSSSHHQNQINANNNNNNDDWLRFSFEDFCAAFFEPVREMLEQVPNLTNASDDMFVASICSARELRQNSDFILFPQERQILLSKESVIRMAKNNTNQQTHHEHNFTSSSKPRNKSPSTSSVSNTRGGPIPVRMTQTGAYKQQQSQKRNSMKNRKSPSVSSSRASSVASARSSVSPAASTAIKNNEKFGVDAFKAMRDNLFHDENNGSFRKKEVEQTIHSRSDYSHDHHRHNPISSSVVMNRDDDDFVDEEESLVNVPISSSMKNKPMIDQQQQQQQQQNNRVSFVVDHQRQHSPKERTIIDNFQHQQAEEIEEEDVPTMTDIRDLKNLLRMNHTNVAESFNEKATTTSANKNRRSLLESSVTKKPRPTTNHTNNVESVSASSSPVPPLQLLTSPTRSALEDEISSVLLTQQSQHNIQHHQHPQNFSTTSAIDVRGVNPEDILRRSESRDSAESVCFNEDDDENEDGKEDYRRQPQQQHHRQTRLLNLTSNTSSTRNQNGGGIYSL